MRKRALLVLLFLSFAARADDLPAPHLVATGRRAGLDPAVDKAIDAGLSWLSRHERPEGGWDADDFAARCEEGAKLCEGKGKGQHGEEIPCPFDDALTAMAALAFLGRGTVPEKALQRLEGAGDPWTLALSTEAFAEAETIERKGRWAAGAKAGAERLLAMRGEDGAWGYISGFRKGSDVPYTALVVPALLAARDVGASLPDDLGPRADAFLSSLEAKEGKLAYLLDGRSYGYTPTSYNAHAASAVRELLHVGTEGARHRSHLSLVRGDKPEWKISWKELDVPGRGRVKVQIGSLSMMAWWHGTVAMFQRGGADWTSWYGAAKSALLGHQRKDGCARGSWDPVGQYEAMTGGRVMATALGVLILAEPYRHLRR